MWCIHVQRWEIPVSEQPEHEVHLKNKQWKKKSSDLNMASGSFVFINSNKVDMTSRSTNEVKSAERSLNVFLHASVCTSASAELLRGASPRSCEDISDLFLIFTVVKAKVIGAGEHSSGVIRAVYEAISRPCLNHNTELQWEMLIMSEFVITDSYRSSQSVPTNGTHGTPLLCRLFGDKPTF